MGGGRGALIRLPPPPPVLLTPDASKMPAPWLLLTMALTLTLTDVPGGCAQPEVAQQEAAMAAKHPGLGDLLHQVERLSLLGEDLQRLRGEQGDRESGEGPGLSRIVLVRRLRRGPGETQTQSGGRLVQSVACLSQVQKLSLATPSVGS